jgi:hypothetical protein
MEKIEGSLIHTTTEKLKSLVDNFNALTDVGLLRYSDQLIWNSAYLMSTEESAPKDFVIIPVNYLFKSVEGQQNPDHKKDSKIKFSKSSRSLRMCSYEAANIIKKSDITPSQLDINSKGKVYELLDVNITEFRQPKTSHVIRSKSKNKEELLHYNRSKDTSLITEIKKVYSFGFSTKYLDRLLAPDSSFQQKTISSSITLTEGKLKVTSSCFDDSKLMTPRDKIVAKYFQSAAIQYMWDNAKEFILDEDANNKFTFNLKECLTSLGTNDSGSSRCELYMSILRVTGNKFEIDGTSCPNFMSESGFIDNNNKPMSRSRYTHLTLIGETDELPEPSSNGKLSIREAPLYVTLAIPDMLYVPTRKALILSSKEEKYDLVRPVLFGNDDILSFKEISGYQDTLSDYLKSKVIHGNSMKTKLKNILPKWLKANKDQPANGVFQFFRSLDGCMLFYSGKSKNARSNLKYAQCTGYFSEFVFECKVISETQGDTPKSRDYMARDYDIVFHHIYPAQAKVIKNRLAEVNSFRKANPELCTEKLPIYDEDFSNWLLETMTPSGMLSAFKKHRRQIELEGNSQEGLMCSPVINDV